MKSIANGSIELHNILVSKVLMSQTHKFDFFSSRETTDFDIYRIVYTGYPRAIEKFHLAGSGVPTKSWYLLRLLTFPPLEQYRF